MKLHARLFHPMCSFPAEQTITVMFVGGAHLQICISCFFSFSGGRPADDHDRAVQADRSDRGAAGTLPGSGPQLHEGHTVCEHQLRGLRVPEDCTRSAVKVRNRSRTSEERPVSPYGCRLYTVYLNDRLKLREEGRGWREAQNGCRPWILD